ncbi:hypothetical protein M409DRAFT_53932 [Zasmidium cellare ATCC 36951]|uniref:Uncharacterized protein n=1 Tax=Zasmidium cellare ATCC 36951 TaxID=1080233 RepID=A0A6A6CM83_ZASCE|nr:uncharacterized protein M409DRAFT_53932 [Zasmidium cellare ATCC 36951]KAF2167328.1 hypothetical protein M409DRAFT_53932 [Zasmidium cellare ATCC 36951]
MARPWHTKGHHANGQVKSMKGQTARVEAPVDVGGGTYTGEGHVASLHASTLVTFLAAEPEPTPWTSQAHRGPPGLECDGPAVGWIYCETCQLRLKSGRTVKLQVTKCRLEDKEVFTQQERGHRRSRKDCRGDWAVLLVVVEVVVWMKLKRRKEFGGGRSLGHVAESGDRARSRVIRIDDGLGGGGDTLE